MACGEMTSKAHLPNQKVNTGSTLSMFINAICLFVLGIYGYKTNYSISGWKQHVLIIPQFLWVRNLGAA